MVTRLNPDLNVACSNHVGVITYTFCFRKEKKNDMKFMQQTDTVFMSTYIYLAILNRGQP